MAVSGKKQALIKIYSFYSPLSRSTAIDDVIYSNEGANNTSITKGIGGHKKMGKKGL